MKLFSRTLIVLWKIVPIIVSFVRDFRRYVFWGGGRKLSPEQHRKRAKNLTKTLGYLGPTFIKVAQVLSARADVLPPVYILELSTLQDKVNPNPVEQIKQVISDELQQPVEAIFDGFEEESLAAASLGQVHRARYHGKAVVVKVLRPGVPQLIKADLAIIHGILDVLNWWIRESPVLKSLTIVLNEFHRVILQEIDFELEAHNVKVFQRNFADVEFVIIPKLYDELTTKKVVVLEYLEGVKISSVDEIEQMGVDIDMILQRLTKVYIHQLLVDGVLHADPHPGNILVTRQGQIIILDFGMVVRIDDVFKHHLIRIAVAIAHRDVESMVNEMYELRIVEPGTNKAMLRELAELMLEIQERGKLSERKVQYMVNALMEAFYEFPFTLPSELVYIGRAVSLIEGIGFIHDPWFDAVKMATPVIKDLAQDVLKEDIQGDLLESLQKWTMRSYHTVLAVQDIILKTDREQLRIRLHPGDLQNVYTMLGSMIRRVLAGVFAASIGMASTLIYLRDGNSNLLVMGLGFSGVCMVLLLLLPYKRPDTTQRHYIKKHLDLITTPDGELYKSLVMSQMPPEERAKAEAKRQQKAESSRQ